MQTDSTMERRDDIRGCGASYFRMADGELVRKPNMVSYLTRVSGPQDWDAPYTPVKLVGSTLAEWMRTCKRDPDAYYIVQVTGHYVLVKGRKFIDNHTKDWVFLRSAPWRRKRVEHVYKVTRV